ncbi:MAG TPA: hypothetical protein PLT00_15375 [Verrucomicrobiota bacterium]|nr:hypothetical protein [Verrucomicrobiota bacterium]HQB18081.1 hypothetical protein [Verrucomicrobiota bacterium]
MNRCVWLGWLCVGSTVLGQTLPLPPRAPDAPAGDALIARLAPLSPAVREEMVFSQVAAGNVPDFLRQLCPVTITNQTEARTNIVTFYVTPDYLAIGADADYFRIPLTPATAQRIADLTESMLPTRKMVDAIYTAAAVKLAPIPLSPGPQMTTVPEFARHNGLVRTQRTAALTTAPLGALVAGHKKDVVLTTRLARSPDRVAIYGWHQTNGVPIQPLYLGHTAAWVDYSHGIRLVARRGLLNGQPTSLTTLLADPDTAQLLSDEGPLIAPRYPTPSPSNSSSTNAPSAASALPVVRFPEGFVASPQFGEWTRDEIFAPEVKIRIVTPAPETFFFPKTDSASPLQARPKPVLLIFYGLPNGNTTDQTVGHRWQPGDDWHFDIQHIGAQTRWLRKALPDRAVVVAYLETVGRSWPAWRRKHGNDLLPGLLMRVKQMFADYPVEMVLSGHSGGGSYIFGYLNTVAAIPDDVTRIAFLDANYAYDAAAGHGDKLLRWLNAATNHHLCVLAYQDHVALLDGKPFVSEAGGTWGRSQAMLRDLSAALAFQTTTNGPLITHRALAGRVQFALRENPERRIYHTVQVEKNGFIHALLTGTPAENRGYVYLGDRVYNAWIARASASD